MSSEGGLWLSWVSSHRWQRTDSLCPWAPSHVVEPGSLHEAEASLGPWICCVCGGVWAQNGAGLRVGAGPHLGAYTAFRLLHLEVPTLSYASCFSLWPMDPGAKTVEPCIEGLLSLSFGFSAQIIARDKSRHVGGLAGLDPGTPHGTQA